MTYPITGHCLVKNEDKFIWFAVNSVLPYLEKLIIYDTGSTDETVKIIKSIKDKRIFFAQKGPQTAAGLTRLRNEMISGTKTDWFMLVDGDEVWNSKMTDKFLSFVVSQPKDIRAVFLKTRNAVGDVWHYLPKESGRYEIAGRKGNLNIRAYRRLSGLFWQGEYPLEHYGEINDQPRRLAFFPGFYWHLTNLDRSSKSDKVAGFRRRPIEKGVVVKKSDLPEVFFLPRPDFVSDPLTSRSSLFEIAAQFVPPLKFIKEHLFIILMAGLFFGLFSFVLIVKHEYQFQTFGLDLGFYDQILYKASHLDFTKSTIAEVVNQHVTLSFFENDFHLPLLVLAFIYRFFPSPWVMFLSQSLFSVLIAVVLYFACLARVKSKFFALAVGFSVLMSVPFQHVIFDGFTPEVFGAFFLALFFYALFRGKNMLVGLSVLGMMVSKVEFSPVVATLGIIVFLFERQRRLGTTIFFAGVISFIFLVYFLNPLISPGYRNYAHYSLGYGSIGANPQEVFVNTITHPGDVVKAMFSPPVKIRYLFEQLSSFAFLPVVGFQTWPLLFFELFTRLGNNVMIAKWPLHSFTISTISGVSLIYAAQNLRKKIKPEILAIILLVVALVGDFAFHGPINSVLKKPFYSQPEWSKANHQLLAKIPPTATVAANNSLVPHLSQRQEIYLLPDLGGAQYIIIDLHDWPNAFTPASREGIIAMVEGLTGTGTYVVVEKAADTLLLKRQ